MRITAFGAADKIGIVVLGDLSSRHHIPSVRNKSALIMVDLAIPTFPPTKGAHR